MMLDDDTQTQSNAEIPRPTEPDPVGSGFLNRGSQVRDLPGAPKFITGLHWLAHSRSHPFA